MTLQTPLIWDAVRGVSRQLDPQEGLEVHNGLGLNGPLSFWRTTAPVASQPLVGGDWAMSLENLIDALVAYGLVGDARLLDWDKGLGQVANLGRIGAYEPGRLIIGSVHGWVNLDQPALEPGVIQALAAHTGPVETLPGSGINVRQLSYTPVSSLGSKPPAAAPQIAALWFDSTIDRLKIWNGLTWKGIHPDGLDDLLASLAGLAANQLVVSDGANGLKALQLPAGAPGGALPMLDDSGLVNYVQLLSIGTAAPWSNGRSIYDPTPTGGGREPGAEPALWFNNSPGAEVFNVWDEQALQWKGVPVASPLLHQLAALRNLIGDGDLLVYRNGQLEQLAAGDASQTLVVRDGEPAWHQRYTVELPEPAAPLHGDLWQDSSDALLLRREDRWHDLNATARYRTTNGFGGAALPGMALTHDGFSWLLAGPATARDAAVALVTEAAAANAPISAAYGGIVQLEAAAWSAVIDDAELHPPGGGLLSGRTYFVSATTDGLLTTVPQAGQELPVGVALSSTRLLLRGAAPLQDRTAVADVAPTAPPAPINGLLWWDQASSTLQIYAPPVTPGTPGSWEPVAPAGGTTPPTPPSSNPLVAVEAIDWVSDPLAGGIRFTLEDGSTEVIRLRGANGAVVTMADNRTLVIDGGGGGGGVGTIDGGRFSP